MTYICKLFWKGHMTFYLFQWPHDLYTQILLYRSYYNLSFQQASWPFYANSSVQVIWRFIFFSSLMTYIHKFFRIGHVTLHFSIASHDLYKLIPPYRSYLPSVFASSSPLLNRFFKTSLFSPTSPRHYFSLSHDTNVPSLSPALKHASASELI